MRSSPRSLVALLVGLSLVAAACGGGQTDSGADASGATTDQVATEPSSSSSTAADADVVETAGPFSGTHPTLDGSTIDFDQFAGQDVVLWFWAPW